MVAVKHTLMNVCADLWPNNKKATVLPFKMGDFVKFCQKNIFGTSVFFHFVSIC